MRKLCSGLIVIVLFLFSCGEKKNAAKRGLVFNYNEMNGLGSLDPATAGNFENIWPVNQLFNGLVQLDDSLNVIPCIARTYVISEDGLRYRFFLRNDVYFHNDSCFKNGRGRKVLAEDFVFSFLRLYNSKVSSALSLMSHFELGKNGERKGLLAINDSTLELRLSKPFNAFLSLLSMKYFSVIPHEAIRHYGDDFRKHPVGTGPFQFKHWEEGTKLVMLKNENYFETDSKGERLPYLDAVTVSFIRDRETAFMELLNGKFDMLSGADAFNINEVLDKEGNLRELYQTKFFLQKHTFLKTDYIGILVDSGSALVKHSPLRLKQVRKAINYAFDREKLIRFLRNKIGTPATAGFIPKGSKSYDPLVVKGYSYDADKVKTLLLEAGYPGGVGLPELTIHITDSYKEQAEFIQSQLAENNIKVNISVEKTSILRQAVNNGDYLLFKKSWFCDYADDENFMSLFYSKNFSPEGVNFFRYKNDLFDSYYEEAISVNDDQRRKQLFNRMDSLIIEDAPCIPLYYDEVIRLVRHNVKGLGINAMNLLNLKTVRKD